MFPKNRNLGALVRVLSLLLVAALLLGVLPVASAWAAPAASTAAAPAHAGSYYVVRAGDNLYRIARHFGTTVQAIAQANGIVNVNRIYVGQRLYIPGAGSSSTTAWPVDSTRYVVRAGDSLSKLARRFNTTVQAIARANGLTNTSYVYVGQRLVIPTGYASPPSVYGFYYTVRPGDTLGHIAKWYGVNLQTLARVNGIGNVSRIYVGQRIYIP